MPIVECPRPNHDDATEGAGSGADGSITNVFVLMLENHSFDHLFAMSGIPGLRVATRSDHNSWIPPEGGPRRTAHVTDRAPWTMSTDPGHEFEDVIEQLCGVRPCDPSSRHDPAHAAGSTDCYAGGPYPDIDLCGFAENYAWSTSEGTGRPDTDRVGDIMACFDTSTQVPVLHQLATEFAVCDAWHSSLPGPTWPNRFFVHGGSSAGMVTSPDPRHEVLWESVEGFEFHNGSIFDSLDAAGRGWRLYQDKHNDFSDVPSPWYQGGWISQAASLKGVSLLDIHSFRRFREDLERRTADGTPAYLDVPYTFIEPNFGASFKAGQGSAPGPTYRGGSAQHPEDDPSGGEGLIKAVYEAIRQSPVWDTSLLIVLYDEHGGFYDSVKPGPAAPPGDPVPHRQRGLNPFGFDFATYGVRVPAVVISPRIPRGTVDHTLYDHTSVLATLQRRWGLDPLTDRDAAACDVRHLLSRSEPRTDCPWTLVEPASPRSAAPRRAVAGHDDRSDGHDDAPLPGPSNTAGFLHVLFKAEAELAGDDHRAHERLRAAFRDLETMGDAVARTRTVRTKLDAAG